MTTGRISITRDVLEAITLADIDLETVLVRRPTALENLQALLLRKPNASLWDARRVKDCGNVALRMLVDAAPTPIDPPIGTRVHSRYPMDCCGAPVHWWEEKDPLAALRRCLDAPRRDLRAAVAQNRTLSSRENAPPAEAENAGNGETKTDDLLSQRRSCPNHPPAETIATLYCRRCGAWKPSPDAPLTWLTDADIDRGQMDDDRCLAAFRRLCWEMRVLGATLDGIEVSMEAFFELTKAVRAVAEIAERTGSGANYL